MQQEVSTYKKFDGTTIKLIAIVLMFIDHVHQMFYFKGVPSWVTIFGRPVFPMFLFLAAEAFYHTKNRKKYLLRLFYASLVMAIGSLIISRIFSNPQVVLINNAFSTFFISVFYMWCWDLFIGGIKNSDGKQIVKGLLMSTVPFILGIPFLLFIVLGPSGVIPVKVMQGLVTVGIIIPSIFSVEGGFLFVILGLLFYIFRENRIIQTIILLLFSIFFFIADKTSFQWLMILAVVPMLLYNGKRGKNLKNFFYIFYPAHIWILYIISTFIAK